VVAYAGTGKTPFSADSPPATAARILTQPPDLSGLSGPLRDLVGYALEKDPANRPTARELLDLLITGPAQPAAAASALADQPGLRVAAHEAQAQTGYDSARQLTALAVPSGLVGYDEESIVTQAVETADVPAPPARTRRHWLPAVAVAVVLGAGVGGATMAVSAYTAPTPTPTATPTGTATATAPAGTPTADRAEVITDALDGPRLWLATTDDKLKASCAFEDGSLVVRRPTPGPYRCRGPQDVEPDDIQLDVNARLVTPGSCAGVWLRFRNNTAYLIQFCEKAVLVCTHKGNRVDVRKTLPLDTPIPVDGPASQISLTLVGNSLTIVLDGATVGPGAVLLDDPDMVSGRTILGLYTEDQGGRVRPKPYQVAFDHISVRKLPA
jgi:hypothetical protein